MSTPEENKALIRRSYEEGVNKRNLSIADEVFSPDYVSYYAGKKTDQRGPEGFRQGIAQFLAAFPDLQGTIEDIVAEGDRVATRQTWRGTHLGVFAGVPPTGKRVTFANMDIYRFEDGKAVEEWFSMDIFGLMQQLGAIPTPGKSG